MIKYDFGQKGIWTGGLECISIIKYGHNVWFISMFTNILNSVQTSEYFAAG